MGRNRVFDRFVDRFVRFAPLAGPAMQFRVADTGIGMSAAEVARLFTAFSQADTATTKRFGGTGLGLAITRHFCTVLGGEVTVTLLLYVT